MYSCPQWLTVRQSHSKRCHEERSLDPPLRQACYGKPNEIQSGYCNQSETRCWVNGLVVQLRLILDGRHDLRPVKSPELDPYRKNMTSDDLLPPPLRFRPLPSQEFHYRSEERRVGKECRSRWWALH